MLSCIISIIVGVGHIIINRRDKYVYETRLRNCFIEKTKVKARSSKVSTADRGNDLWGVWIRKQHLVSTALLPFPSLPFPSIILSQTHSLCRLQPAYYRHSKGICSHFSRQILFSWYHFISLLLPLSLDFNISCSSSCLQQIPSFWNTKHRRHLLMGGSPLREWRMDRI